MLTGNDLTADERIARVSFRTVTDGIVIVNATDGIDTTRSWTRIATLQIDTGLTSRAFGAGNTFRTTFRRYSEVARFTRAHRRCSHRSTDTV